eukprot:836014-Pleurochrysis_carterae.AAC.1
MVEVVGNKLVVKCDHATTVLFPDDLDQSYCCLDAVLMGENATVRGKSFQYSTTSNFNLCKSMSLLLVQVHVAAAAARRTRGALPL